MSQVSQVAAPGRPSNVKSAGKSEPVFENWSVEKICVALQSLDLSSPINFSLARNENVAVIQRALITLKFLAVQGNRDSKGGPDGKLGTRTISAIIKMRQTAGDDNMSQEVTKKDIDSIIKKLLGTAGAKVETIPEEKKKTDVEQLPKAPKNLTTKIVTADKSPEKPVPVAPKIIPDIAPKPVQPVMRQPHEVLSDRIIKSVNDADRVVKDSETPVFAVNAIYGKFKAKGRNQAERAVMRMARKTYEASYHRSTGDLDKTLACYSQIYRLYTSRSGEMVNLGEEKDPQVSSMAKYYINNARIMAAEISFRQSAVSPQLYPETIRLVETALAKTEGLPLQYCQASYVKAKGLLQEAVQFLQFGQEEEGLTALSAAMKMLRSSKTAQAQSGKNIAHISNSDLEELGAIKDGLSEKGQPDSQRQIYMERLQKFEAALPYLEAAKDYLPPKDAC